MASLFTNASAMTALQTLSKASKSLAATQNRVSTGYRINTAEDNAAYWSIATTLRSDVNALGAVKDALGLGAATIDTVYTGINDTKDLLDQIKSKLVAASQSGVPRAQVQAEITQLQNRLADVSKSTVINSETWLTQDSSVDGYNNVKDVVGSFTRAAGVISIETIQIDISGTKLYENSTKVHSDVSAKLEGTDGLLEAYSDKVAAGIGTDSAATGLSLSRILEVRGIVAATWTAVETGSTGAGAAFNAAGLNTAASYGTDIAAFKAGFDAEGITNGVDAYINSIANADTRAAVQDVLSDSARRAGLEAAIAKAVDDLPNTVADDTAAASAVGAFHTAVQAAFTEALDRTTLTSVLTADAVSNIKGISDADWNDAQNKIYQSLDTTAANATGASGLITSVAAGDVATYLTTLTTAAPGPGLAAGDLVDALNDRLGTQGKADLIKAVQDELTALGTLHATDGAQSTGRFIGLDAATASDGDAVRALVAESNAKIYKLVTDALDRSNLDSTGTAGKAARDEFQNAIKADENNQKLGIFDRIRTVVSNADGSEAKAISVSNIDISGLTDSDFDKEVLSAYLTAVDDALSELTLSASIVGAAKSRIEGNRTFVQNLVDANNRGIGQLVDADLNEESSKLKALQVQEQLAIQALSIANNSTQNVLSLFQ